MRTLSFFICILFFTTTSFAQEPLTIFSVEGPVKASPNGSDRLQRARAGTKLSSDGVLRLKRNQSAGLYMNGIYRYLSKPGTYAVQDIMKEGSMFMESDASIVFNDYLAMAQHPYFDSVRVERSGFTSITTTTTTTAKKPPMKDAKDGHGNADFSIIRISPTNGKVVNVGTTFEWQPSNTEQRNATYTFMLSADGTVVYQTQLKGTTWLLRPDQFRMQAGTEYTWQVMLADDPGQKSAPVSVTCVPVAERAEWLSGLYQDDMYQQAGPAAQQLLKAAYLEFKGYLADAYSSYQAAANDYRKNMLAQDMYEAFLWRYDMVKAPQ